MMKKITAVFLAVLMLLYAGGAMALGGLLDSLGDLLPDDLQDKAGELAEDALGSISDWAGDAFDGASDTVKGLLEDVMDAVREEGGPWEWFTENLDDLKSSCGDLAESVLSVLGLSGDGAEEKVGEVFEALLKKLNIDGTDMDQIWDTVRSCAEETGTSVTEAVKLALPYLLQMVEESAGEIGEAFSAADITQYLQLILEKIGISAENTGDMLDQLEEALEDQDAEEIGGE